MKTSLAMSCSAVDASGCDGDKSRLTRIALALYLATSAVPVLGVTFGYAFIPLCTEHPSSLADPTPLDSFLSWDGQWYYGIAQQGYKYRPDRQSNTAFLPLYPLCARLLHRVTRLTLPASLILVSHLCLAAAFGLMMHYVAGRERSRGDVRTAALAAVALGLFPGGLFFRMAYAESMFLLLLLLAMLAMQRSWNHYLIAGLIGLATTCRLLGVALLCPLGIYLLRQTCDLSWGRRLRVIVPTLMVASWGVAALMTYGLVAFERPSVFFTSHNRWGDRAVPADPIVYFADLGSLAPARDVFDPKCVCYWGNDPPHDVPMFNMSLFHPLLFLSVTVLVLYGLATGELSAEEAILAAALLVIPYTTRGYVLCMAGAGRHASVVFPGFIAAASIVRRDRYVWSAVLGAASAVYLFVFSALFARWYWVF